ncbi:MAG: hypothetical protein WBA84_09855 [Carnobacterium sp.]|uniref:hypothetical protein n=1 Tax=Carnobacterium sp. TaxID=48221 RepID=UPI003C796C02
MNNIVEQKFFIYTDSVKKSLKEENWTAALSLSLIIPDMCSNLEYFDLKEVGIRYRKWFDNYLHGEYNDWHPMMSAYDFYALRCAYLHAGESDISGNKQRKIVDEFKFMAPKVNDGIFSGSHKIKIDNYLILRVDLFCLEICEAVKKWISKNKDNKKVQIGVSKIIEIKDASINYSGVFVE